MMTERGKRVAAHLHSEASAFSQSLDKFVVKDGLNINNFQRTGISYQEKLTVKVNH
jgi:hypothetical protein